MVNIVCQMFMILFIILYFAKIACNNRKNTSVSSDDNREIKIILDEHEESIEYVIRKIIIKNYFSNSIQKIKIMYPNNYRKKEPIKICSYLQKDYPNVISLIKK